MGSLHDSLQNPPTSVSHVGIGAYPCGAHVGLLFRDGSAVRFLHLCFHRNLKLGAPDRCRMWVSPDVDVDQAPTIIANALLVFEKNKDRKLTYGFSRPDGFFSADGSIILGPGQVGLTCATFVLAIFDLSGTPLLEYDTWRPRPDDQERQEELIRLVEEDHNEEMEHVKLMRAQLGSVRFRPLEVMAGGWVFGPPVSFSDAEWIASLIRQNLASSIERARVGAVVA
jgi:hypothetical protein